MNKWMAYYTKYTKNQTIEGTMHFNSEAMAISFFKNLGHNPKKVKNIYSWSFTEKNGDHWDYTLMEPTD